ncbi:MAG: hypothetical protein ACI9QD_000793 [Thermoproteota archaeon]|jgi:hypothetical protein
MSEKIVLMTLPISEAKEFQDKLFKKNVEVFLNHNEATCTRGCSVTVEVSCLEEDIEHVVETIQTNFLSMVEGHNIDWDAFNATFDPNQEQNTCPACTTKFATTTLECPECGLCFG